MYGSRHEGEQCAELRSKRPIASNALTACCRGGFHIGLESVRVITPQLRWVNRKPAHPWNHSRAAADQKCPEPAASIQLFESDSVNFFTEHAIFPAGLPTLGYPRGSPRRSSTARGSETPSPTLWARGRSPPSLGDQNRAVRVASISVDLIAVVALLEIGL